MSKQVRDGVTRNTAARPEARMSVLQASILGLAVAASLLAGLFVSTLPLKIVFGAVAGIVLFIIIYRNIQVGLILFVALNATIPQAGLNMGGALQVGYVGETRGLHFNFQEIVMLMVLIAWLFDAFFLKKTWREKSPLVIPILGFVGISIVASFIGLINGSSVLFVGFRFVRSIFFVYIFFVVLNNVKSRKQVMQLIAVFLICATLVAGYGLLQKAMGQVWAERQAQNILAKIGYPSVVNYVAGGEGTTQAYRINSTFLQPNVLGGYLVFALPFFISLLWSTRKKWLRLLLLAGLVINLACLFFTGSRAAWIAAVAIFVFLGVSGFFDRRVLLAFAVIVMLAVIMVVALAPPAFVQRRFSSQSATEANKQRMYQYELAVDVFLQHPFFGIGMGMEGKTIVSNGIQAQWMAVENLYLTYLVSIGAVGLLFFLLVLAFYWGILFRAWRRARDVFLKYTSEGLSAGMIGIAVASLFGAWLIFATPMVSLFWFFIGMGAVTGKLSWQPAAEPVPPEDARRALPARLYDQTRELPA